MHFFYRFEGLSLVPGNKTAGFDFVLASPALLTASRLEMSPEARSRLHASVLERLRHARLASRTDTRHLGILFHGSSWAPRAFSEDAVFGGSLGADPETFGWLERENGLAWLGEEVRYTPHNVDTPRQALRLMLLVQAWAEAFQWAMPQR